MRIAHFTDIHITERPSRIAWRDLGSKRAIGWMNLTFRGRYSVFRDAAEVTRALVRDLDKVAPDHIVSTGDLSALALESELAAARLALAPLLEDPRVTGIPGNHDVYVRDAVERRLYEQAFGAWTRTDFAPEDFPPDLRGFYPYPLVRFLGADVALLCLNDVGPTAFHDSSGRAGAAQLRALEHVLRDARVQGRTKILALHCGLCRGDGRPDRRLHGLRDAAELRAIAAWAGVALVIHGHIHGRFVIPRGSSSPFVIANPGSLTSRKPHHARAYHVYTVERDAIEIEARRFDDAARAFVRWPQAPGAGRCE